MIPASTNRAHLPQHDLRCDTVHVLDMARKHPVGHRFADMNACPGADDDWNLHWVDGPERNHFTHWIDQHGSRVRMPKHLRHRPVSQWKRADVVRWRKQLPNGQWVRPFSVAERQQHAKARRVVICWELKSTLYRLARYARRIVAAVDRSSWTGYFMTLVTMRYWGPKLRAIHNAGGQTALLPHGAKRTTMVRLQLALYRPYIQRQWGAWHR